MFDYAEKRSFSKAIKKREDEINNAFKKSIHRFFVLNCSSQYVSLVQCFVSYEF